MLTQTTILSRPGWSRSLITRLLGEPDLRKKVPGRSTLAALYRVDRVEQAERSTPFHAAQSHLANRRMSAAKGVETKMRNLLRAIEAMQVEVAVLDMRRLRQVAICAYNDWNDGHPASLNSDEGFLARICVNYIRHQLTHYDSALAEIAGRTGVAQGVDSIRRKVYAAIAAAYPAFAVECERQRMERGA